MSTDPATEIDTTAIAEELSYEFGDTFTSGEIESATAQAQEALSSRATVQTFLPILVKRHARELLTALAQTDGRVAKTVPELLFVCVHNAGRSQMAAAIADHLAAGKVHVRSAGSRPTGEVNPSATAVLAERGIDLSDAYPKPLSDNVLHAADVIVTMGCGDECPYFPGKRYEDWEVADPDGRSLDEVRDIRDDIQTRITQLLRELDV